MISADETGLVDGRPQDSTSAPMPGAPATRGQLSGRFAVGTTERPGRAV